MNKGAINANIEILKVHGGIVDFCLNTLDSKELAAAIANVNFKQYIGIIQAMTKCYISDAPVVSSAGEINPCIVCIIDMLKNMAAMQGDHSDALSKLDNMQITPEIAEAVYKIIIDINLIKC